HFTQHSHPVCLSTLSTFFLIIFFFYSYGHHQYLPSFPTRRSSDLEVFPAVASEARVCVLEARELLEAAEARAYRALAELAEEVRSEEHTSELQSQSNLVCRLLLEKKKKNKK